MNLALFFAVLTAAADCGYAYLNYDVEYHQRHHARRKFNVCEKRLRFNFDKIASNDYIIAPDTRVNAVIKFRDISQMHKHELRRILLPHEDRVSIIVSHRRARTPRQRRENNYPERKERSAKGGTTGGESLCVMRFFRKKKKKKKEKRTERKADRERYR